MVEATKASRILRTRGEIGRRFLFAAVARVGAVPDFFAPGFAVFGEEGLAAGFAAGAGESCVAVAEGAGVVSDADCFSETGVVAAGANASWGVANADVASAAEDVPLKSAHTPARPIACQHLRPNPNIFFSYRANTRLPELILSLGGQCCEVQVYHFETIERRGLPDLNISGAIDCNVTCRASFEPYVFKP
ncbi:MAG: hypothetical protein ACRD3B_05795 [Candidatus Sulfotelmatobacter sp.]